jgi:hypothetical protein
MQAEIEMVEVWLDAEGKEKLKVPATTRFATKIRGKVEYVTLGEMLFRPFMSQPEFTRAMQALAEEERQLNRRGQLLELERRLLDRKRQAGEQLEADLERLRKESGAAASERPAPPVQSCSWTPPESVNRR